MNFVKNDYEIMKARGQVILSMLHSPRQSKTFVTKYKVKFEDLMLVNFIHRPNNTVQLSNIIRKKSSWVSDLFGGGKQPVLWLKDGHNASIIVTRNIKVNVSSKIASQISDTYFMSREPQSANSRHKTENFEPHSKSHDS